MLAVLLSAVFMAHFDFFVVNVAAPSLRHDLHIGDGALELVVGGYAFAYAAGLVTGGRLGDLFGHRRLFVTGMVGFTAASLLCGLAAGPLSLVAARLAQGLSAAAMLPQVLGLITASFPPRARARAIAWYGLIGGLGSIAGQVLGGLLVSADLAGLGWRLVFLVNLPVGAAAAALAARVLPPAAARAGAAPGPVAGAGDSSAARAVGRAELDPVGAVGLAAALALALVPLSLGGSAGWPVWTWVCLAASVPVGAATLRWQRVLARRGGAPVLDVGLLRTATLRAGLLASAAFMAYFVSYMFTLTLLLQAGLGLDPFAAGLAFAPAGVTYSAAAMTARHLVGRYGLRALLAACATSAAALTVLVVAVHRDGTAVDVPLVVVCAALISLGNGVVLPSLIGVAMAEIRPREAGVAAGMLSTVQQFAGSAGVALVGTAYFAVQRTRAGAGGYASAMTWAGLVELALLAAVAVLLVPAAGATRRR